MNKTKTFGKRFFVGGGDGIDVPKGKYSRRM